MSEKTTSAIEWAQFVVGTLAFGFMLYANVYVDGVDFSVFWLAIPGALLGAPLTSLIKQGGKK